MHRRLTRSVLLSAPLALSMCGGSGGSGAQHDADGGGADSTTSEGGSDSGSDTEGGVGSDAQNDADGSGSEGGGDAGGANGDGGDAGDASPPIGASVLQFHNHATRDGVYVDPLITAASAPGAHIDATFHASVDGNVYAQPLYVENGPSGKSVFIVVTENNNVYALDENGAEVWKTSLGTPAAAADNCGNIQPLGITGTPVADLARRAVYLDSALPGTTTTNMREHAIHALSLDTGKELVGGTSNAWPVRASTVLGTLGYDGGPVSFVPNPQNQRGALVIAGGTLYVPYGGHAGDCVDSNGNDYRGWIIGVPLDNPAAATGFATQAEGAGMWSTGGLASDGANIFATTGNSNLAQNCPSPPPMSPPPGWAQQEAILRFQGGPVWSGQTTDYWAPDDWPCLDNGDVDVGSSSPVLVDLPSGSPRHLVVALGKDGNMYVADRANLGGVGPGVASLNIMSGEIKLTPTVYTTPNGTYLVVLGFGDGGKGVGCASGSGSLVATKITPGTPPTIAVAWCAPGFGAGSPIFTTSDGTHDNLVWAVGAEGTNMLNAWDADTGAVVFDGGAASNAVVGAHRFSTIIEAKGRIFAGADNTLYAFTTK